MKYAILASLAALAAFCATGSTIIASVPH